MKIALPLLLLLIPAALFTGSVSLSPLEAWGALTQSAEADSVARFIVVETRLPQMLTAVLSGSALAVCGLVMQTLFANPLADPSLLGVSSGASLGAAIVMLALGGSFSLAGNSVGGVMLTTGASFAGAMGVIALIAALSSVLRSNLSLLVAGVMLNFALSAVISLLSFYATADGVHSYVVWGLGDFSGIGLQQIPLYAMLILIPTALIFLMSRQLNVLLLGTDYAANLGVRIRCVRTWLLLLTGLLTAVVTAHCGPISFIGLSVPHISRMFLRSANHRSLLPTAIVLGADVALLALIASHIPGERGTIPLAAITPLIGVPIVLYILVRTPRYKH